MYFLTTLKGDMRKAFWEKINSDRRNFKWFYDTHIKDKIFVEVVYNTLYQQAKGELLTSMDDGLRKAMEKYLNEKV